MKRSNLNTEYWFPTPIWNYKLETISDDQYKNAINFCERLKETTPGRIFSNVGGWQSEGLSSAEINGTPLEPFFAEIMPLIKDVYIDIGSNKRWSFNNAWVNINGKNNSNKMHVHPMCDISGVFYITSNNSPIRFFKNYDLTSWWLEGIMSNCQTKSTYNEIVYIPNKGDVIIFPAWLRHQVDNNTIDNNRISIAFNIV